MNFLIKILVADCIGSRARQRNTQSNSTPTRLGQYTTMTQSPYLPLPTYQLDGDTHSIPKQQLTEQQSQALYTGTYCKLVPLQPDHATALYDVIKSDMSTRYSYLRYGPFHSADELKTWITTMTSAQNPQPVNLYCILVQNQPVGYFGYLRCKPLNGAVEIGHVCYSTKLSGTAAATEAMYLLINYAVQIGYRRVEWKCNARNQKSFNAALRYGFAYEGMFKHCEVSKHVNRDTAWFAICDDEWVDIQTEFKRYLNPHNFDSHTGKHITRLNGFTANYRNQATGLSENQYFETYVQSPTAAINLKRRQ